jgi:hypothetical protein
MILLFGLLDYDAAGWTVWFIVAVGLAVSLSVFTMLSLSWRQRRGRRRECGACLGTAVTTAGSAP